MSGPARSAKPEAPKYRLADDALTPEELARLDAPPDPVDAKAAIAWMLGEGPDPWLAKSS